MIGLGSDNYYRSVQTTNSFVGVANYVDGVSIIFVKVICAILHCLLGLALTVNLGGLDLEEGWQWLDGLQPSGSLVALRWTSTILRYFTLFYYFVEQWRFAPPTSATEVDQDLGTCGQYTLTLSFAEYRCNHHQHYAQQHCLLPSMYLSQTTIAPESVLANSCGSNQS